VAVTDAELEAAFRASPLFQELERRAGTGPDPIPDSNAKRHHFIPQFLLRRFLASGSDRLCQLAVGSGTPRAIAPASAASRRHFYAVTDDEGDRHNKVESLLAIVESHAATALARLLDNPAQLEPGDRATLSYFFGLIGFRTPTGSARLAEVSDAMSKAMFAGRLIHPDVFAHDYREAVGEASDEEIEQLRAEMLAALRGGRVELEDPRAHAITSGLQMSGDLAATIYPDTWKLVRTDAFFVTSDTGLAMYDPKPRFPWAGNAWRSSPAAETTIPLSSNECLVITPGDDARLEIVDGAFASFVDSLNLRTYGWASDFIYGRSQEVVTHVRRIAKQRPADIIRPRPTHQMLVVEHDPSDRSLALAHLRRGWPAYLEHDGVRHDYIVIGIDGTAVEAGARASRLARQRAERP
jgi:hypothetical protein